MLKEWDGTPVPLLLKSHSCMPVGEQHTVNGTNLPLSRGVSLQPTSALSISPVLIHIDPMALGDFRSGNLQRSFVTHHPPSTSTFTLPQNSQPDLFLWVSKAHSVPKGYVVIAWNWNAKRLQMLWKPGAGAFLGRWWRAPVPPGWLGWDRQDASLYTQKAQHTLPKPPAPLLPLGCILKNRGKGRSTTLCTSSAGLLWGTQGEGHRKDMTPGHRQYLCLYQCS